MGKSDDDVVEIPVQLARTSSSSKFPADLSNITIKCSACGETISQKFLSRIRQHVHLRVLTCKKCYDFYDDGNFTRDESGDQYCRWCAEGGKLIVCDNCTNAFCTKCINRNMGKKVLAEIKSKDNWSCFCCDPTPLMPHVKFCEKVLRYRRQLENNSKSQIKCESEGWKSETWGGPLLEQADKANSVLNWKLSNLKGKLSESTKGSHVFTCMTKLKRVLSKHNKYIDYLLVDIRDKLEDHNASGDGDLDGKVENNIEVAGHKIDEDEKDADATFTSYTDKVEESSDLDATLPLGNHNVSSSSQSGGKHDSTIELEPDTSGPSLDKLDSTLGRKPDVTSQCSTDDEIDFKIKPQPVKLEDNGDCIAFSSSDEVDAEVLLPDFNLDDSDVEEGKVNPDTSTEKVKPSDQTESHNDEVLMNGNDSSSSNVLVNSKKDKVKSRKGKASKEVKSKKKSPEKENGDKNVTNNSKFSSPIVFQDGENETKLILEYSSSDNGAADNNISDNESNLSNDDKPLKKKTTTVKNSDRKSDQEPQTVIVNERSNSDIENEKARKSLLNESFSPVKNKKRKLSVSSSSSSSSEKSIPLNRELNLPNISDDTKLKTQPFVSVKKLRIAEGSLSVYVPANEKTKVTKRKSGSKVDKQMPDSGEDSIDELTKIPENKKTVEKTPKITSASSNSSDEFQSNKSRTKKMPKRKVTKRETKPSVLIDSDSSDDADSEVDTRKSKQNHKDKDYTPKSSNALAKDALLMDSDNSSSDSIIPLSSKKAAAKSKENGKTGKAAAASDSDSGSSIEFVKNKYSKFDKLLRESINKIPKGEVSKGKEKDKKQNEKAKKTKKAKRLKVDSDSEKKSSPSLSSSSSAEESDFDEKPKKSTKKRKRIKNMSNSDESDGQTPSQETPSKGRKNIRKLMTDRDLGKDTKMASVAEKERRERVKARQKLYNQVTEEGGDFGEMVTKKLVLEVDNKTKEELVEVPEHIICKLKPHQVDGVKFMWECVVESLSRLESNGDKGSGCVLAHCMGLGKTLQVIAFICTLLNNARVSAKIKTVLITCPLNTIRNWSREFDMWIGDSDCDVEVFEIVDVKGHRERADVLKNWHSNGGVMIMSYEQFRSLVTGRKVPKSSRAAFEKTLLDPGPDLVICDEGHVLKNETSALSKTMGKIRTLRRVILTGTPLQNNLVEYHCMIQFVKPLLLGTRKEFQNRFIHPISNGQCADSNQRDVKLMKKRVHILHKLLEGCVQRRDYGHVMKYLQPKFEFVISVRLSEVQIKLYQYYLDNFSGKRRTEEDKVKLDKATSLFKDHAMLKLIWTHPFLLQMQKKKADLKALFEEDSMSSFINDDSDSDSRSSNNNKVSDEVENLKPSTSRKKSKKDDSDVEEVVSNWKTRSRGNADYESDPDNDAPSNNQWWNEFVSEEDLEKLDLSGKMLLIFEILRQCELVGDKVLLFTNSLLSLDLMEELLQKLDQEHRLKKEESIDLENMESVDAIGTWENGVDYFRMDGSTSADVRKKCIEYFNNPLNDRARLFMISTRAGSLGTNLVGANRVIILDASWNPTHDVQAIFRVFRFGQKKPVYVYRLLAQGAMEEIIYDRQVTKQSMAFRVVDEQQIERHFNAEDLEALYSFNPDSKSNRPTPMVPKDRLLAELLINKDTKDWIVTYHEHDSLLENITAEELTEDERKVAWAEYEAEREGLLSQVQQGQGNYMQTYLLEMLEKYPTDNLGTLFGRIKTERPTISTMEVQNMVLNLDRLCIANLKELQIVSTSLQKNNENLPEDMKAKMLRYVKLIEEIKPIKDKQLEEQARLMAMRRQQQQLKYQQQLRQQAQFQQQQAQFQQQQQQAQFQQQYRAQQPQMPRAHPGLLNQQHLQNLLFQQQQQFQQRPVFTNVNNTNRCANDQGQRNYSRQNVIVTRPIITEDNDDTPSSSSAPHSKSSGPIITEID